ncbi:Cytochrome c oxidase assembly protein cox19 [Coccidioides posadasii str. Silveira]|uniref:Cytochrome c oxidase assembly protein COX19 n=5 Tax=Coccidioides TaxID=5500 RepID=E9D3F6_COCPS|nr:cytochrome c oxidase assembly protein COX19 [Coccidioides posadasii str. Silveira]KMM71499.1 cytochrome c oxidase assembly protein COX19 [Coccidioides posadasii RMSCC 3488]KMP09633.1 cytochrome c oxidase assembly protein COX19 [Coccidioides immitis RMSCC 2394]KMU72908.1 cytochrome c oxidase assembly protein COX19 [Coccidioides immitis RMSCC 3703]KMU90799.1 cytochrome c oxidase assembly protein COX19 [Coccidioides immitis H538.4]TPX20411.1 Cytochrome c oxidase assembly protein cox19 [Coccidi
MSFGSPGGRSINIKPTPPERGSFPLDHDGECKYLIASYLHCLKSVGGVNDERCRKLAKGYLNCRMENNLMAPDDFKNLGLEFNDDAPKSEQKPETTAKTKQAPSTK